MKFFLDFHSRTPIYEQIKEQITSLIGQGELKEGDQLPSLRQLSTELSVNINTIKRAFSDLELNGIIYSVAGKGSFISGNSQKNVIVESALEEAKQSILKAKSMGAKKIEMISIVNSIYEGDETSD
ncbi:MAG: GntR family transcriptional regulator [Oscillospiraceae bacterium]|nr:GntR family transcriptional regulator [Oscillospiraceae bacterium]